MQRRTFVQGLALASFAGLTATNLEAKQTRKTINTSNTLSGKEFFLDINYSKVNITGKPAVATTVNGQLPGPTLIWQEGDTITLHVTNHLKTSSSIHWHGIILPAPMDGVPGISFNGIAPGKDIYLQIQSTAARNLLVSQPFRLSGTDRCLWCHCHQAEEERTF